MAGPRTRRVVFGALALFFVAVVGIPWLASFATDWLWFREVHFDSVFLTSLVARVALFFGAGVFAFVFLYANLRQARPRATDVLTSFVNQRGERVSIDLSAIIPRLILIASIFVSFITALVAAAQWMPVLMAIHGSAVGDVDPVFGRDIGFYLFRLPAISAALGTLVTLTVLALAAAMILYVTRGVVALRRRAAIEPSAAIHVGSLLAFLFILFAVQLWIVDSSALLYSSTGPLAGASYADVHASLPGIRISAAVALLAAGIVIYGIARQKLIWFAAIAIATYAGVGFVFRFLIPVTEQKFVVAPNELARERTYLQQHIAATRRAWRLDSVTTRDLSGDVQLTMADIRANAPTIDNVRLWERDLLKQTFGQLQEIRTYYDFASVSDDRYVIDGRYRQVHISARELNTASLPT
ncbi:MAG TPA: UPF0182 family protein, partial [Gemmatimonadaceae bacterium]